MMVAALMADLRGRHPQRDAAHVIAYVESYPADATPQQRASLLRFRNGSRAEAERRRLAIQEEEAKHKLSVTVISEADLREIKGAVSSKK